MLIVALAAPAAYGQGDLPALVSRLDPAWQRLEASNAMFLTKDQAALLDDLSFATAAVEVCPGFKVDRKKFVQGFEGFKSADYMKLPPEQKRKLEYRLMVNFGATVALYTAEGLLHPKEACRIAEKRREGGPGRFWVQPASTAPAP